MTIKKAGIILLAGFFLSACGVVKRGTVPFGGNQNGGQEQPASISVPENFVEEDDSQSEKEIKESLQLAYNDWKGVPYLFGGSGYSGIDCSAFMQVVFGDYFSKILPRTTGEQLNIGFGVKASAIKTGDLVFFKTGTRTFHVGVMVNEEQFLHASTSLGVIISTLSHEYWKNSYLTTRRVL